MKHYYTVKDSLGNVMRTFKSYKEAENYRYVYGNPNWYII